MSETRARAIPSVVGIVNTEELLWFMVNIGLPRSINWLYYLLSIEMFIDELEQNIGSINMIKRGDRYDW